jgi:predicted GNAT superfamily acetyltransferase
MMDTIQIQPLSTLDEMRVAVELQKTYWGDDLESVIPAHMLYSLANFGGHVLAALDGEHMVGVLVGFLGTNIKESERPAMANLQLVSKRMVVLPAYRNRGIGYRLKLAQRDLAIKQGIRLVTWTFDPLVATNAHLNIRKLGAVSHTYYENYYGTASEGSLTIAGASDRMLVEWWVTNRRVQERINGKRGDLSLKQYLDAETTILNPTVAETDGTPWPSEQIVKPSGAFALLEIPLDYVGMARDDKMLAQAWRAHSRMLFGRLLTGGYLVTDFIRESYEGRERAFYVFSHGGPQFDFSQN